MFSTPFLCRDKQIFPQKTSQGAILTLGSVVSKNLCLSSKVLINRSLSFLGNLSYKKVFVEKGKEVKRDLVLAASGYLEINKLVVKDLNLFLIAGGDLIIKEAEVRGNNVINLLSSSGEVKIFSAAKPFKAAVLSKAGAVVSEGVTLVPFNTSLFKLKSYPLGFLELNE
ncbi:MAG: hypothetical protein D6780_07715 [Candidatus Dadabacteria bacterium]|nr:MAG: hypothetical protein D6780_07715 [Candidatus Dadabacteria bacterium]